ncbi:MAG: hypothetical protein ACD_2C00005G0007 [uncultured bacterium (gcode 4)]|uniref:Uncharacterized protein n=1 Tax=uncultured bacterium (gcode 4) TaxID=1234023 RepID=K2G7G9_9BACT|nr:MAG: hypothetical protein ACD_2C00005G0007 [uncultured bacterium (gcode 4)]
MTNKLKVLRIIEKWTFAWYEIKRDWRIEEVVISVCSKVSDCVETKWFFDFATDCVSCKANCNLQD